MATQILREGSPTTQKRQAARIATVRKSIARFEEMKLSANTFLDDLLDAILELHGLLDVDAFDIDGREAGTTASRRRRKGKMGN